MVRELAERGVREGNPAAYISTAEAAEVDVPATLQATIAARIDRLDPKAKRTLSASSVLGSRLHINMLTAVGVEPVVAELLAAQLIDQVRTMRVISSSTGGAGVGGAATVDGVGPRARHDRRYQGMAA